ncbi:MAG: DUF4342 domain-containing protein [Oscillospiraceae bacterium]|nr:DUF4342 domain-containing protein [Oscillospiraceae bacterium]
MDRIEMVEKLREKTGVGYEEAKAALEASDWDLLDAVVLLEKQGKVRDTAYSTKHTATDEQSEPNQKTQKPKGEGLDNFMAWVGRVLHKGNTNTFVVMRNRERKLGIPVTVVALLLIFAFYFTIPVLVVSLFFGFHYKFEGPDLGKDSINHAMNKASQAAEAVKEEFREDAAAAKQEVQDEIDELEKEIDELNKELDEDYKDK